MIYFKKIANLMYDVFHGTAPILIQNLFTKSSEKSNYFTRFATKSNFQIKSSRLEIQKRSFSRSEAGIWNSIPDNLRYLSKSNFKRNLKLMLANLLESEDVYICVPEISFPLPAG